MYEEYTNTEAAYATTSLEAKKEEIYGNRKRVSLANAKEGEYFVFVSPSKDIKALLCLGARTKYWFEDKNFAKYSDRKNYDLPYFKITSVDGETEGFVTGVAVKIDKDEYDCFINKFEKWA